MKEIYLKYYQKRNLLSFVFALIFLWAVYPASNLKAQTVSGSSQCENGGISIGVTGVNVFAKFALYHLDIDGNWARQQIIASDNDVTFASTYEMAGKYVVYQFGEEILNANIPTGDPTGDPNGTLLGHLWIYSFPAVNDIEITGFYTGTGTELDPYIICNGLGEVMIEFEPKPTWFDAEWYVTYELYKYSDVSSDYELVPNSAKDESDADATLTDYIIWDNLSEGDYIIKAFRGDGNTIVCTETMDGNIELNPGLIQNTTKTLCYPTIQDAIDDADATDVISIGADTYVEDLTVSKSLTFISDGEITIDGTLDITGGSVLTGRWQTGDYQ